MDVREFAVQIAAEIMGSGTPDKNIVAKAKEIEAYVIGDAELPEVHDEVVAAGGILQDLFNAFSRGSEASDMATAKPSTKQEQTEKKQK